jgi:hypothetical protein
LVLAGPGYSPSGDCLPREPSGGLSRGGVERERKGVVMVPVRLPATIGSGRPIAHVNSRTDP